MAIINKTGITDGGTIQAEHVIRAIDALSGGSTDSVVATGSFDGILTGTASFATTALSSSYALSASYAANVPATASYALAALSSSYAVTASFALNAGGGAGFPFTGSAQVTGSMGITGSLTVSGSARITSGTTISGSLTVSGSTTVSGTTNLTGSINVLQNDSDILSGRITGGASLFIDLTEVGKSPAAGTFIIPNRQPDTPYPGSIYIDGSGRFYIYDGSNWRQIQYA